MTLWRQRPNLDGSRKDGIITNGGIHGEVKMAIISDEEGSRNFSGVFLFFWWRSLYSIFFQYWLSEPTLFVCPRTQGGVLRDEMTW